MDNKIVKYVFIVIVIILICFSIYQMQKDDENNENTTLDQTSTVNTIQKNLRLAISNFDTINPILTNNRNVQEISKIIYDPLVTLNSNYKLEYKLATEIAKIDDLNYVIKLRENVKWHDGSSFTANDVKYTIDTIKSGASPIYSSNLSAVTQLDIVDEHTVKIILSYPVEFFEYNLTFPILSANQFSNNQNETENNEDENNEDENNNEITNPIGTGLFKISSIDSNIIKLAKNTDYWNKEKNPMAEEIDINLYNTAGEVYNAFKNGDIDILDVKIDNSEDYIGTLGYKKIEYKSRDYDFLAINTQNKILSDSKVRKALSKIIDKNNIVASCLGSGYVASNFSLDMGQWLYTKDLTVDVNLEEAKQILTDDGWEYKNGKWTKLLDNKYTELTFTISVNGNDASRLKVAENIKTQLQNFGIIAYVKQLNNESYDKALKNKNYDIIVTGITCGFSPSLSRFIGEGNLANYSNQEVNEIAEIIKNTTDENTLYEKYNRLYEIYLEEAPYIGLYRKTDCVVYNQNLVGNIQANAFNIYYNIEKWYRQ